MPVLAQHCDVVLAPDTSPATLARLVADADGLVVRAQLQPDLFDHAPKLRAIVRHGVGLDMIPVEAATARGIPVANLPGSNTQAVAEYALAAMLHLRRGLATMDARMRSDGWAAARPLADRGTELGGSVCGIVGVGAIGSRVAAPGERAGHAGAGPHAPRRGPARACEARRQAGAVHAGRRGGAVLPAHRADPRPGRCGHRRGDEAERAS